MRIYRDTAGLPADARGASVAIGNFDGLHRGHREVIRVAAAEAARLGAPTGIVTFEPHPRELLDPAKAPERLTTLRRKAQLASALGVDVLYVLRFDEKLMRLSAEAFVDEVLVGHLGVRAVAAGSDFCFGYRRQGDVGLMARLAAPHGVAVNAVPKIEVGGVVCSSTAVRNALAEGDVARAATLLGSPYEIEGVVKPGDTRGRTIGFPTANVHPFGRRPMMPARGVYVVRAGLCVDGREVWHPAVANLGNRPTFHGRGLLLEVHLLDGGADLYSQRLRVGFLERLRAEQKFAGIEELKAQIARDCEHARSFHGLVAA
ncbi:MAG: bifunctional riboflavin kinase/FAD synthetase [Geminicoccaceae bacterium]